jgi:AcrR family transcriptional regulator
MAEINQYRQELRNKIIDYAMAEFYKRGVKAVKMDVISRGLHVSKRTVYEIFGDKEELLLAGMKMQQAKEMQALEEFANTQARNVIDIISYVYKLQMRRNEQVGVVFYEEIHKIPRVVEFMREYHSKEREEGGKFFATGVKEGLFRPELNYEVLSEVGHVAMEEIMHRQLYRIYSMQELFDNYVLTVIRGFCTERGLMALDMALAGL